MIVFHQIKRTVNKLKRNDNILLKSTNCYIWLEMKRKCTKVLTLNIIVNVSVCCIRFSLVNTFTRVDKRIILLYNSNCKYKTFLNPSTHGIFFIFLLRIAASCEFCIGIGRVIEVPFHFHSGPRASHHRS